MGCDYQRSPKRHIPARRGIIPEPRTSVQAHSRPKRILRAVLVHVKWNFPKFFDLENAMTATRFLALASRVRFPAQQGRQKSTFTRRYTPTVKMA